MPSSTMDAVSLRSRTAVPAEEKVCQGMRERADLWEANERRLGAGIGNADLSDGARAVRMGDADRIEGGES
jgi:hypothetical protein